MSESNLINSSLNDWLTENDVQLFLRRAKMSDARKQFNKEHSTKVNRETFSFAVYGIFEFWKVRRLNRIRKADCLSGEQWVTFGKIVEGYRDVCEGLSVLECVEVIRTEVSLNASMLLGLPKKNHIWEAAQ